MSKDTPTSTSFIFVDRRGAATGKSLPNRQRLLKRIRDSIRAAKPEDLDIDGVTHARSKSQTNPIRVARSSLEEPTYRYEHMSGELEVVLPGNDIWEKGDDFPISGGDEDGDGIGDGEGGPGDEGEDDFIINISRDEFYDVFFEDCELPNLEETHSKDVPEAKLKPAGFQKEGLPVQLSVVRSFKNSFGRRQALGSAFEKELKELEAEYKDILLIILEIENGAAETEGQASNLNELHARAEQIELRIAELQKKLRAIPFMEKVDQRFRKSEKVLVKAVQAALIMTMDVSGSMDEERKRMARKFFAMQYVFITRTYPDTDLVFIIHTDRAHEVQEEEFFTTRLNGGTVVSTGIAEAHRIVKERYDPAETNLYWSYAGDGDNWISDNEAVLEELLRSGFLSKLRHAVYIQVGEESYGSKMLWQVLDEAAARLKFNRVKLESASDVFGVFKKIYRKG